MQSTTQTTKRRPRQLSPWRESMDGPLLTVSAASNYLKVGKDTVRKLWESGDITSIEVMGARRIVKASVDEWIRVQALPLAK